MMRGAAEPGTGRPVRRAPGRTAPLALRGHRQPLADLALAEERFAGEAGLERLRVLAGLAVLEASTGAADETARPGGGLVVR